MRPFVAVVLLPLRRLAHDDETRTRSEAAGKVDNAAEKLRRAKKRADSVGTPTGTRSVPDHGVGCVGTESQCVFAPSEDLSQVTADSAKLDGEAWIKTDLTVDTRRWV
mgnify:CR=1 FL=1